MPIRRFAADIWRWLWLIALASVIAGATAYGVSSLTPPVYAASTRLLINQAPATKLTSDYNSLLTSERLAKTYAEILRTRPVMTAVIERLHLDTTPASLAQRTTVSVVRDTQLIELSVEDSDPDRAATIANTIVEVFAQQNRDLQLSRYTSVEQELEHDLAELQANIDSANANLAQLQDGQAQADVDERVRLQSALAEYRDRVAKLNASLTEMRLAVAQASDTINAVESAQPNLTPVRPHTLANALLAALAGALLAIATIGLTGYLDDTVKSTDDVQSLTNLVTLATIGSIPSQARAGGPLALMLGHSPIAEAYRMLRVNLDFASVDGPVRTIVVTSSSPGEGKSTTVANLAIALAQAGKRVILVDADLRRPTLHTLFGRSNARGVTTALFAGETARLSEHLVPTPLDTLWLLPSGPLPPNPADLLGSQRMAGLMDALTLQADVVLFDTPPLLAVVDAALMASACDATLLVASAGETRVSALRRANEQLKQSGARLVRAVLNRVDTSTNGYYGAYYGSAKPRKRLFRLSERPRQPALSPGAMSVVPAEPPKGPGGVR